ncbi:hypothetical protein AB0901_30015 [Streptomyces roseifaciens]
MADRTEPDGAVAGGRGHEEGPEAEEPAGQARSEQCRHQQEQEPEAIRHENTLSGADDLGPVDGR